MKREQHQPRSAGQGWRAESGEAAVVHLVSRGRGVSTRKGVQFANPTNNGGWAPRRGRRSTPGRRGWCCCLENSGLLARCARSACGLCHRGPQPGLGDGFALLSTLPRLPKRGAALALRPELLATTPLCTVQASAQPAPVTPGSRTARTSGADDDAGLVVLDGPVNGYAAASASGGDDDDSLLVLSPAAGSGPPAYEEPSVSPTQFARASSDDDDLLQVDDATAINNGARHPGAGARADAGAVLCGLFLPPTTLLPPDATATAVAATLPTATATTSPRPPLPRMHILPPPPPPPPLLSSHAGLSIRGGGS